METLRLSTTDVVLDVIMTLVIECRSDEVITKINTWYKKDDLTYFIVRHNTVFDQYHVQEWIAINGGRRLHTEVVWNKLQQALDCANEMFGKRDFKPV